jgi:hypothetical protein
MNLRQAVLDAIEQRANCDAVYVHTQPVRIIFDGKVLWKGKVEVFDLKGHPFAKRAFGWAVKHKEKRTEFITVMGIPPLDTPLMAAKAYLANQKKY